MSQDLWRTGSVRFRGVSRKSRDKDAIVGARAGPDDTVVEGITFKAIQEVRDSLLVIFMILIQLLHRINVNVIQRNTDVSERLSNAILIQ